MRGGPIAIALLLTPGLDRVVTTAAIFVSFAPDRNCRRYWCHLEYAIDWSCVCFLSVPHTLEQLSFLNEILIGPNSKYAFFVSSDHVERIVRVHQRIPTTRGRSLGIKHTKDPYGLSPSTLGYPLELGNHLTPRRLSSTSSGKGFPGGEVRTSHLACSGSAGCPEYLSCGSGADSAVFAHIITAQ